VIKLGQTVVASEVGEHKVENVDEALRSVKAKRIDVAILSHPHDDHVENLIALVEEYTGRSSGCC
jgi:beta-lactamase superfamily II metal-dependent hydrolase